MSTLPKYPGERITANGNQLVSYHTEARIADAGIFYPITPSTEGGELYQQSFAEGRLNVFGRNTLAVEPKASMPRRAGPSRTRSAAAGWSTSPRGRASSTASSSTTMRRARPRRWWSRWWRGRSPSTP